MAARFTQQLARLLHVGGVARKGHAEIVDLESRSRADVVAILVGQRARRQAAALPVDALAVAEFAADQQMDAVAKQIAAPGRAL